MNRSNSTTKTSATSLTSTSGRLISAESRPISRSSSFDYTLPPEQLPAPPAQQQQQPPSPALPQHQEPAEVDHTQVSLFDPLPQLPSRLRQATLKLVPPPNFGFIEASLFRAGEPAELSLNFIQRLNLHSLLWLAPHPPSLKFQEFLLLNSIHFHDLGIQHAASLDAVTEEAVTHALQLILNPSIYPLMIMCGGGSHRTGTVVGCLRKLQGWNLASIFEEYRRYAGAQHHIMNEQFIEFYNVNRLTQQLTADDAHQDHLLHTSTPSSQLAPSSSSSNTSSHNAPNQVYKRATPSALNFHQ
ncbi:hypothetical protein PCANC_11577 [Puccinia coronata f. sp. avenae]|uniref:Putative tyrosine-protein phosphatase OCA1 n=1 Tax=Puccinia coronata f. sp. avenae TaxID=200324 RepID=A0A2N5T0B0_9BASI|nr:hypothetical protein PCANC_12819 [Puccinia coronata f. sp. avenae]PLW37512.1 hypothetical protein PCASD_10247 [Puccinia coronata f. sp. avenae]PLW46076.1 hypothetical protein PCANC_11577 [Puccinia coronata f. sp. avenae]